jgi:hypothetical protein
MDSRKAHSLLPVPATVLFGVNTLRNVAPRSVIAYVCALDGTDDRHCLGEAAASKQQVIDNLLTMICLLGIGCVPLSV